MAWSQENPGAGEPWGIRNEASVRTSRADDLRAVQGTLAIAKSDAGSADWTAKSRDAFVAKLDTLSPGLALLIQGLDAQAAGLARYAAEVEQIQDAQRALEGQRDDALSLVQGYAWQRGKLPDADAPSFLLVDPSEVAEGARLDEHIEAEQSVLRNNTILWDDLVMRRRVADSVCAQQLGSVQTLGPLSSVTAALSRNASTEVVLERLGSLSSEEIQVLLGANPGLTIDFQDRAPDPSAVRTWWDSLDPAQRGALVTGAPAIVGALDGLPWDTRFTANQTNISAARTAQAATITDLREQIAAIPLTGRHYSQERVNLQATLTEAVDRADTYETMAGSDHQVLLFDPAGNGRYAEVHGTLTDQTRNVGVIINGTTLNMDTVLGYDRRAGDFYDAAELEAPGSVVTITWMGTDLPGWDTYVKSDMNRFATEGGPRLARFVTGIDELTEARIGVFAHSAAGAVAGSAEKVGMPGADYVVHVESAGAGPGVRSVADYAEPGKQRFVMTAPDDPIQAVQNTQVLGADPDKLAGITTLESGYSGLGGFTPFLGPIVGAGAVAAGAASHDGVFEKESTGWNEMYRVLTQEETR